MALRILMTGDDDHYLNRYGKKLRQHGFSVHVCSDQQMVNDRIERIKPDVVFINSRIPDEHSTEVYHQLIDNIVYASIPIIFTLLGDDVYLINKKRTTFKDRRYIMSNDMIDAIRMAVIPEMAPVKKRMRLDSGVFGSWYRARRA